MFSSADHVYMSFALQLAERGIYSASPNPRVGCVIVQNGQVVGSGWHDRAGQPHAEINALNMAGVSAQGATVYLTLEPCSHFGRTPPCVNSLLQAGVAKAIIAIEDPNPLVSGSGCTLLKQAGVDVHVGLLENEARALNIGFITRMVLHKPLVRLKIAASLDGKVALSNGASQWITGMAARQDGHRWRARSCAIMTGIGTVNSDDPQLTVRHVKTPRQPKRILVDSHLTIPMDAKLLDGEGVFIFTISENKDKILALRNQGVQVVELPDANGNVDLFGMMTMLADFEINELLVEAGSRLSGALVRAKLVDELIVFLAPHLIGDQALSMLSLPELIDLEQKQKLKIHDLRMLGQDIRIIAKFL